MQIACAERCEAATGLAGDPAGAAAAAAADGEDEDDPLDAFMAEINALDKSSEPAAQAQSAAKSTGRFHEEDEYDPAAEFVQVGVWWQEHSAILHTCPGDSLTGMPYSLPAGQRCWHTPSWGSFGLGISAPYGGRGRIR